MATLASLGGFTPQMQRLQGMDQNAVWNMMRGAQNDPQRIAMATAFQSSQNPHADSFLNDLWGGDAQRKAMQQHYLEANRNQLPTWDAATNSFSGGGMGTGVTKPTPGKGVWGAANSRVNNTSGLGSFNGGIDRMGGASNWNPNFEGPDEWGNDSGPLPSWATQALNGAPPSSWGGPQSSGPMAGLIGSIFGGGTSTQGSGSFAPQATGNGYGNTSGLSGMTGGNGMNYQSQMPGQTGGLEPNPAQSGADPLALNVNSFLDPSMQFRMDQGMNALQNSAAARGGLLSGNTMKGIQDYSQGLASQEYGNAFGRAYQDRGFRVGVDQNDRDFAWNAGRDDRNFNLQRDQWNQNFGYNAQRDDRNFDYQRLSDLSRLGLAGTQGAAGLQQVLATLLNSNIIGGGNAGAAGSVGGANAFNQMITQLLQQLQSNAMLGSIGGP